MTNKESKQRYFDKVYESASWIKCACGCGSDIKSKDKYGRDKKYISGHNTVRKYDHPTQYKREWNHRNKPARDAYKKKYIRRFRIECIDSKGSECKICHIKYDGKNAPIFDFHHRDPSTKDFNIAEGWNRMNKQIIKLELEKCDLICSNCHRIEHLGSY